MMNSLVEEMVSSFDVTPLQTEDGSKLSDQIQQMLDEGATINGTATVNADGTMTENVTVVSGNEDDKNDSFADSGIDLLSCRSRRSQSLSADVYLVLFDISGIRNLVLLLF